jgi:hypothetical protein
VNGRLPRSDDGDVALADPAAGVGLPLEEDDPVDAAQFGLLGVHRVEFVRERRLDPAPERNEARQVRWRHGQADRLRVHYGVERAAEGDADGYLTRRVVTAMSVA